MINFYINNLLNFIRIRISFKISLNLIFNSKLIKLFNIFNNNIIILLFSLISTFPFIIHFINNIDSIALTNRSFDTYF